MYGLIYALILLSDKVLQCDCAHSMFSYLKNNPIHLTIENMINFPPDLTITK